jgi:hypothetical protein
VKTRASMFFCIALASTILNKPAFAFVGRIDGASALFIRMSPSFQNDKATSSVLSNFLLVQQKTGNELIKCNADCEAEYRDCNAHGIKQGKEMRSWQGRKDILPAEKCTMQKAFCIEWNCIKGVHPPDSFYQR